MFPHPMSLRTTIRLAWRRFWVKRSGQRGFGRLAARLAALHTMPFHGRTFLADFDERGFISPDAAISHPDVRLGRHVFLGDKVVAFMDPEGGPIELGDRVQMYGNTFLRTGAGARISIGPGSHIQPGCYFIAEVSDIRLGSFVEIAADCSFYPFNHGMKAGELMMGQPLISKGPIVIGDGAWLGHGVHVLGGVRIGEGAVIGAGSVVVKDVPANAIAVGVPAKVIGSREPTMMAEACA